MPGNGTMVIGAAAGAYAPGIDVTDLAGPAPAAGGVTGGAGAGLLSAVFTAQRISAAVQAAGVPARAVRKTSPVLTAQVLLAAPFHRDKSMQAAWRGLTARGRETDTGYDPPAKSSISDACHHLGPGVPAFALAAVIGSPPPAQPGLVSPGRTCAAGPRGMSGPVTCADEGGWSGGRWHGIRVKATDGTHFALPGKADTSVNWRHFGSAAGSRPLARMVAVTDVWHRTADAVALGKDSASEHELARHLLPAFGPGMLSLADRGFPSRQAAFEMIGTGADFAWRVSASWNLRPCGRPLPDGSYLTKLTWHGRTMKARVIEFHIDFLTTVPVTHPLLESPAPGAAVTVTVTVTGPAAPGMVTVHVSENFTIITSLRDTAAYPAGDIAALYGDRWTIELVFYELKVTVLGAGTACRSPHPGGAYPEILYAIAGQHALRLLGAHCAATLDIPAGRVSAAALRAEVITSAAAGHGDPALLPAALTALHADITRHPSRWIVPHRPGRHYPRYTIKKIRSRKPGDIVPGHTRMHLLPLTVGGLTAAPCAACPPVPAPAEVTPRPG